MAQPLQKQAESKQITQLTRICVYHCNENSVDREAEAQAVDGKPFLVPAEQGESI